MKTNTARPLHPAAKVSDRNVISVASGKGGVGKTWLSITLAHALARRGDRVLLFDADLGLANVDIQLGLPVTADLGDVMAKRKRLAEAVTRFDDGEFDIVAGQSGSGGLATLPVEDLRKLRQTLYASASVYDRVVIDLGAGVDLPVRVFTPDHGICLVVTTDEPTALTDAYAFLKLTYGAKPDADLRIVVNDAGSREDGLRTYDTLKNACENFLGRAPGLAGLIRHDKSVAQSIRAQTALLSRHPNCEAAGDVEQIAQKLTAIK